MPSRKVYSRAVARLISRPTENEPDSLLATDINVCGYYLSIHATQGLFLGGGQFFEPAAKTRFGGGTEPVDEEDAVEVVDFVLDGSR